MAKYYEKIGEMTPDNLIASINVGQIVVSGTIAAGAGEVKRGTVMSKGDDGKLSVMKDGATPFGILTDTVKVGDTDEVVEVYIAGSFNKNALIVGEGYALTADDIQKMRDGGIYVENAVRI
jgi:hypothetical protein